MSSRIFDLKFRVWHVPQVPGEMFTVEVPTYAEAERLKSALADYDLFQYHNNIKPDYCNASGIQIYQHDLTEEEVEEMGLDDRWVDIEDDQDLQDYLDHLRSTGWEIKS